MIFEQHLQSIFRLQMLNDPSKTSKRSVRCPDGGAEMRPDNPIRGVVRFADRQRKRRLTDAEYAAIGSAIRASTLWPAVPAATRFLAITGWRSGEALGASGLSYILRNDAYIRSSPATAPRQASVAERPVVLPPEIQGANCHVTAISAITAAIPAITAALR